MNSLRIRPLKESDRAWVIAFWREHWGSDVMAVHGELFHAAGLPGFVAELDGAAAGLVTYQVRDEECEVLSLDSLQPGWGIGRALLGAVALAAQSAGCARLVLVTTNDNLTALRFYQRLGLRLRALRPGAVEQSRRIKPEIPLVGEDGIPIRDELELELPLDGEAAAGIVQLAQTVLQ